MANHWLQTQNWQQEVVETLKKFKFKPGSCLYQQLHQHFLNTMGYGAEVMLNASDDTGNVLTIEVTDPTFTVTNITVTPADIGFISFEIVPK